MTEADDESLRTEMQVRRALGLDRAGNHADARGGGHTDVRGGAHADPGRARRRFVQDGEVPVVVMHSDRRPDQTARVTELETAREAERSQRAGLARALDEARALVQSLQTRLTHAELAHAEALAAARAQPAEPASPPPPMAGDDTPPSPPRRGRPPKGSRPAKPAALPTGEPVRWWEPEFRTRKAAR